MMWGPTENEWRALFWGLLLTGLIVGVGLTLLVSRCVGAEIVGPETVEPGAPAWYAVADAPAGSSAVFLPSLELEAGPPHLLDGHALFWTRTPGRYVIHAIVVDWDAKRIVPLAQSIVVGPEPGPDPNPEPDPNPDPDPIPPVVQFLWSFIVEESSERTAATAAIMTSPEVRSLFRPEHFRVVDQDNRTNKALAEWIDKVPNGSALPYWFLTTETGRIVHQGSLPQSVDDVVAVVKKYLPKEQDKRSAPGKRKTARSTSRLPPMMYEYVPSVQSMPSYSGWGPGGYCCPAGQCEGFW